MERETLIFKVREGSKTTPLTTHSSKKENADVYHVRGGQALERAGVPAGIGPGFTPHGRAALGRATTTPARTPTGRELVHVDALVVVVVHD